METKKQLYIAKYLIALTLSLMPIYSLYASPALNAENTSLIALYPYLAAIILLAIMTSFMLYKSSQLRRKSLGEQKTIVKQAHYDNQTGLPNRTLFYSQLKKEIKSSRIRSVPLALLFIDLDLFKEVNDQYGHSVGDQLLTHVAERLKDCVKSSDKVARLAGDEFTVIITDVHDLNMIEETANKILSALSAPFEIDHALISITCSIGSTIYPNDSSTIKALMKNADMAMYESKNLGKNCYQPFNQSIRDLAIQKQTISKDLKTAINEDEFSLVYQPVVELKTNAMLKAEALIRWEHPEKGIIGPDEFISIAENSEVISHIGDWVFKNTLKDVLKLQQRINPSFSVSLNVSPKQLGTNSLLTKWPELLKIYGLEDNSIGIEITEGLLLESNPMSSKILNNLRNAGAQLLIDDFGTGYSSLSYLKKLNADFIKIDQSFVKSLSEGSEDMVLCETIIMMAHKLGLKAIAEGIETQKQLDLLLSIGCDYGQGYLFSEPKSLAQLIEDYGSMNFHAPAISASA